MAIYDIRNFMNKASNLTSSPETYTEEHDPVDPTYSEYEAQGPENAIEVDVDVDEADHVEAEHDYGRDRSSKGSYSIDVHDFKGRGEHTGRKLRVVNQYGDNPMVMDEDDETLMRRMESSRDNVIDTVLDEDNIDLVAETTEISLEESLENEYRTQLNESFGSKVDVKLAGKMAEYLLSTYREEMAQNWREVIKAKAGELADKFMSTVKFGNPEQSIFDTMMGFFSEGPGSSKLARVQNESLEEDTSHSSLVDQVNDFDQKFMHDPRYKSLSSTWMMEMEDALEYASDPYAEDEAYIDDLSSNQLLSLVDLGNSLETKLGL